MNQEMSRANFGRVFDAAVSADWAITEDGFRTILAVASRTNAPSAVEAFRSEEMKATRTVKVRSGVAIIPVTGPISRYMSWFSAFSGGTSISVLGRDFQAALDDPEVHSIMFEINSPGGEVTGVNEFAQMVYKARSRKPITARVGGSGCSAAYWIAAMCGDVVIDQTAQLGSIGVMAVYIDDRKRMEAAGLNEIEFISSQSPYKNAPPYTDEGRARIQKRIDALAQVFVEAVGRGRGVSTDTVLKDFGQGDVFVGQDAVKAGLADRFGSYEETIRLLAKTHTPFFVDTEPDDEPFPENPDPGLDDEDDEYAEEKTINISAEVDLTTETSGSDLPEENLDQNEESMETKDQNAAAEPEVENEQSAAAAPAAPAKEGAAAAAAPARQNDETASEVARLTAELERTKAEAQSAADRIAALETEALDKWIADQCKDMIGEEANNRTVIGALVAAHGKDSAEVKAFLENQTAIAEQAKAGELFAEIGKGANDTDNSPANQLEAKAKALMAADPKLTIQQARTEAYEQNPDLYAALQAEG